jgi:UDP-N-acetylmuramate dehydrogenase
MSDTQTFDGWVRMNEPMHRHTSLKVGGAADFYAEPNDEKELMQVLGAEETLTIVGGGTNLLVSDNGIRGVVLNPHLINREIVREPHPDGGERWTVGAGVTTVALVRRAVEAGMKGAEVLAGVPGSVGGAVIMNAGGHDGEIKDTAEAVCVADRNGVRWISAAEAGFGYRRSGVGERVVVLAVRLHLQPTDKVALEAYVKDHMQRRQATQPLRWPNAGSFFKNPPGDFAGRLIEACGLKGTRIGTAEVSPVHANFFVRALDDAEERAPGVSQDFVKLIARVRHEVWQRFSVWLELEVRPVGDFPPKELALLREAAPVGERS